MASPNLSFITNIDFENIYNLTKNEHLFDLQHESSVQRLIAQILKNKKEIILKNINAENVLRYYPFLDALQQVIYKQYREKSKASDIGKIEPKDVFKEIKEITFHRFDMGWEYDKENNTVRKNGEKLIPISGRFFNETVHRETTTALFFESKKDEVNIEELSATKASFFWVMGRYFQTEGFSNRIYFNVSPNLTNFRNFIEELRNLLNERNIPFKLKFSKNLSDFQDFLDSTVLYYPRENTLQLFEVIKIIEKKFDVNNLFDEEIPLFTKEIIRGVGFGESPDDTIFSSFGSYRASVLSVVILEILLEKNINKFAIKQKNIEDYLANLILTEQQQETFFGLGKNWLERFYTNQFSTYDYSFHFDYLKNYDPKLLVPINKDSFLYGAYLVATIIWNEIYFYPNWKEKELFANWIHCEANLADEKGDYGYQYVSLDATYEKGIPGVVFFLMNLQKIYPSQFNYTVTYRAILSFCSMQNVDDNAEMFFSFFPHFKSNKLFNAFRTSAPSIESKLRLNSELIRKISSNEYLQLIDKVVFSDDLLSETETNMCQDILENIRQGLPFRNFLLIEEPNFSLGYGYALLGYFFLRLYNTFIFPKIDAKFIQERTLNDKPIVSPESPSE